MPGGVSVVQEFLSAPRLNRIPNVSHLGWMVGLRVSSEPVTASDGEGILQDDMNWVHGTHVLQAGEFSMYGIKRQNVFTNPRGSFRFKVCTRATRQLTICSAWSQRTARPARRSLAAFTIAR